MSSIRRRLLVWLLSSVLLSGMAAAVIVFVQARQQANSLFDYQLRQIALTLRDRAFSLERFAEALGQEESSDFVIAVWGPDGRLLYRSHPDIEVPAASDTGFTDAENHLGSWRVFATWHRGLTIQVAQHRLAREILALRAAWHTLLPFLLVLPVMGWLIWRLVGQEMKALERTAQAIARRSPESLAPIETGSVAQEIEPLVQSLNGLLARLGATLGQQREFIADAAHELRTPLTALKLQLQLAERARDAQERQAAHGVLREGIERATHVVEQLLALARADPGVAAEARSQVDLAELARSVAERAHPAADAKGLELAVDLPAPLTVGGDPHGLRALLENLVDNAIRYTAAGRVSLRGRAEGDHATIEVEDTGPGIAPAERERVFDRFYRAPGGSGNGSGLGLAIARRVAERHGGTVELLDPPEGRGLLARVRIPLSPA